MSKQISNLLAGLHIKPRAASKDPDRRSSAYAETPRSTKKTQEILNMQTLNHQFARASKPDGSSNAEGTLYMEPRDSTSSRKTEANRHSLASSSKHRLEQEHLARQFQEAHAEVGRNALELRDMVLEVGEPQDDTQHDVQRIYNQLMRDSAELLSTLAHKMSRLRTKIDLSSPVNCRRKQQSERDASPTTRLTQSHKLDGTQHCSGMQPRAPERGQSHSAYPRRAVSVQRTGKNRIITTSKQPLLSASGVPPQCTPLETKASEATMLRSRQPVADEEATWAKYQSGASVKTTGDLPPLDSDELLRLDQPSTFPDLPIFDPSEDVEDNNVQ